MAHTISPNHETDDWAAQYADEYVTAEQVVEFSQKLEAQIIRDVVAESV